MFHIMSHNKPLHKRMWGNKIRRILRIQGVSDAIAINGLEVPISAVISLVIVGISLQQYTGSALLGATVMTAIAPLEGYVINVVRKHNNVPRRF